MSKHNDWIDISYRELAEETKTSNNGIVIRITTSPYDVPHKWRFGTFNRLNKDYIQFEFLYLSDEPTRSKKIDDIEFIVGKNSRRVHKISLPKGDNNQIKLELVFEKMETLEARGALTKANTGIIQTFFRKNREKDVVYA